MFVAADHFGVGVADAVVEYCVQRSLEVKNLGSRAGDEEVSLQELVPRLVEAVRTDPGGTGVLVCGTGVGVEIGANRFVGIRASLCVNAELAKWARQYDNANVLCLSGWQTRTNDVSSIMDAWLSTEFDADEARTRMLAVFDSWAGR